MKMTGDGRKVGRELEPRGKRKGKGDRRLDELLKMLDAAAKGPEKVNPGDFMAAIIAKGNRIRDDRQVNPDSRQSVTPWPSAAGFARSLASIHTSGELETAAMMLAATPFLVAGLANPIYLLAGCAVGAGWALVRGVMGQMVAMKRGLD